MSISRILEVRRDFYIFACKICSNSSQDLGLTHSHGDRVTWIPELVLLCVHFQV